MRKLTFHISTMVLSKTIIHYKIRSSFIHPFGYKKIYNIFFPGSCSELVSSLNPFYLKQYSRSTKSEFEYLQNPKIIQRPFKIWVLSEKAREKNIVKTSARLCHLLIAFVCWNWKSPQIYEVIFYIDTVG